MATRKTTAMKTSTIRLNSERVKRRRGRTSVSSRRMKRRGKFFNFLVPLVFILAILFGLGVLMFKGYQTVAASNFFDMKKLEIRGLSRVPREDVEKVVRLRTESDGVWNAELDQIKADVEKIKFVKTAIVSRVLPDGISVRVEERVPKALVRGSAGEFWVDDDGMNLGIVGKNENRPPFVLVGWNDENGEKAKRDNKERVKLFLKIKEEIQHLNNIKSVDLNDLRDAQVFVDYGEKTIPVKLGTEEFGKRLQKAIDVIRIKQGAVKPLSSYGTTVNEDSSKSESHN